MKFNFSLIYFSDVDCGIPLVDCGMILFMIKICVLHCNSENYMLYILYKIEIFYLRTIVLSKYC